MTINIIGGIILIYLMIGIITLGTFELRTKRLSKNLNQASINTQNAIIGAGSLISNKAAKVLIIIAIFLFWPFVFIGLLTSKKKENSHGA